jgi:DNA polymerase-1
MSGESLAHALKGDPDLQAMLACRARYEKLLSGFLIPWIKFARENEGRLHPLYNQVRTPPDEEGNSYGTRTGRLSCIDPNFQQVAKPKKGEKALDYFGDPYPNLRAMLLPEEGHVWVCADLKCQEPRITAHFECGQLMAAFLADHNLDPYIFIRDMCELSPDSDGRDMAKVIFLGLVYAMGKAKLAAKLGISENDAGDLRWFIKRKLKGIVDLDNECKDIFKMGGYLVTLGGRHYYCEPSLEGKDWSYKALNTLVQGSAGDQTKETIIYVYDHAPNNVLLMGTVHDEMNYSAHPDDVEALKEALRAGANHLPCDIPMLFDIGVGANWAEAKP